MATDAESSTPLPATTTAQSNNENGATTNISTEWLIQMASFDPPRYGWSALGGIVDLLTPHERARRKDPNVALNEIKNTKDSITEEKTDDSNDVTANTTQNTNDVTADVTSNKIEIKSDIKEEGTKDVTTLADDSHHSITNPPKDEVDSKLETTVGEASICQEKEENETLPSEENCGVEKPKTPDEDESRKSTEEIEVPATTDKDESKTESSKNENIVSDPPFKFDLLAYHRGRAGFELRDENTGALLSDTPRTDTNHGWKANLKCKINICFPLGETDATSENDEQDDGDFNLRKTKKRSAGSINSSKSSEEKEQQGGNIAPTAYFRDSIVWDLGNSQTPTPQLYAGQVAAEYGLSFGQTIDLAHSIQTQINDFSRRVIKYRLPIALLDPFGKERPHEPMAHSTPATPLHTPIPLASTEAPPTATTITEKPKSTGRKRGHFTVIDYRAPQKFRDEVIRRAKIESNNEIVTAAEAANGPEATPGKLTHKMNHVCHVCHARKTHGAIFPCGIPSHAYCNYHLESRLGFGTDEVLAGHTIPYCPICCVTCICPKCARKHDAVALEMQKKMEEEGITDFDHLDMEVLYLTAGQKPFCRPAGRGRKKNNAEETGTVSSRMKGRPRTVIKDDDTIETETTAKQLLFSPREPVEEPVAPPQPPPLPPPHSVVRIPASMFPREMCKGKNLDPATGKDYKVVFGSSALKKAPLDEELVEDGNINYCFSCFKGGGLLCCDRCPRAYHFNCLDVNKDAVLADSDEPWFCRQCTADDELGEDDKVTGMNSLEVVLNVFTHVPYVSSLVRHMSALAKIHELLLKLLDFDFAYVFRTAVRTSEDPDYTKVVSKPMDLGKIAMNLVNGAYSMAGGLEPDRMDDMTSNQIDDQLNATILEILQDIELVWHNCLLYNKEGSTYYRMAEVQQRKYSKIMKSSIEKDLNSSVKKKLKEFVERCINDRKDANNDDAISKNIKIPYEKNLFEVAHCYGTNRVVAVLDPTTGRIVKMYTTLKAALKAAYHLSQWGYESEIAISDRAFKSLVKKSTNDYRITLFGYRWLYHADLVNGTARFDTPPGPVDTTVTKKSPHRPMEEIDVPVTMDIDDKSESNDDEGDTTMTDSSFYIARYDTESNAKVIYHSILEAYDAFEKESNSVNITRRIFQRDLDFSEEDEVTAWGYTWKRVVKDETDANKDTVAESTDIVQQENEMPTADASTRKPPPITSDSANFSDGDFFRNDGVKSTNLPKNVILVKEDVISGKIVKTFSSKQEAFEDWLNAREVAQGPQVKTDEDKEHFTSHYLFSDSNIDGFAWHFRLDKKIERAQMKDTSLEDVNTKEKNGGTSNDVKELVSSPNKSLEAPNEISASETIESGSSKMDVEKIDKTLPDPNCESKHSPEKQITEETPKEMDVVSPADNDAHVSKHTDTSDDRDKKDVIGGDDDNITSDRPEAINPPEAKIDPDITPSPASERQTSEGKIVEPNSIENDNKLPETPQKTSPKRPLDSDEGTPLSMRTKIPKRRKSSFSKTDDDTQSRIRKALCHQSLSTTHHLSSVAAISLSLFQVAHRYDSIKLTAAAIGLSEDEVMLKIKEHRIVGDNLLLVNAQDADKMLNVLRDVVGETLTGSERKI